jgi:hypothetical protein
MSHLLLLVLLRTFYFSQAMAEEENLSMAPPLKTKSNPVYLMTRKGLFLWLPRP